MWWIFWAAWVLIGTAIEIYAIKTKRSGDTLSEQYWRLNALLERWPALRWLFHIVTIGGLIWAALHFVWGFGA